MTGLRCRFCATALRESFCDLGMSPLSNAFLQASQLGGMEPFYPLHAFVCSQCWLVQLPEHRAPETIFKEDYAYFSSFSDSWLAHCRSFCDGAAERFGLGPTSLVIELASNDGYLLQYFKARGVPVLGIEPSANVAQAAIGKGIPTRVEFFGEKLAQQLAAQRSMADLVVANNVLAHVPDINDFVVGIARVLKPDGVISVEAPHLLELIRANQFDTIYHEHYSYLSLGFVDRLFNRHGLRIFDVEKLGTHGGSLRIYGCAAGAGRAPRGSVSAVLNEEAALGLSTLEPYRAFDARVRESRFKLLEFLIGAKRAGKKVWGYGAPAKGNTLLNYCGVRADLIEATVDRSPHKQNRFLPGSHIPVLPPERVAEARPDYLLILAWNLEAEVVSQMAHIRDWGGKFVVPIPEVSVLG